MCGENRNWAVLILGTTLLSLCGCGGGSAPSQSQPTPVQLFSVSPLPTTFEPAFTMQINGAGFAPGAVLIGAVDQGGTTSTTFVSSTLLTVDFPASYFSVLGMLVFQVQSPNSPCNNQYCSSQYSQQLSVPVLPGPPATMARVNLASDSTQANAATGDHFMVNPGGGTAVFDSAADNLVPGDTNGKSHVFLRDTCLGATGNCTPATVRVSLANDRSEGNGDSTNPGMTSCGNPGEVAGRFVVFQSSATNLVSGDMNTKVDIFVRDTCRGVSTACTPSTIRVSVASDGTEADGDSTNPVISCDGRFVAFQSVATNLVPNDTNAVSDVFVRDTCLGATGSCTPSTALVSANLNGTVGNGPSVTPAMDQQGESIVFQSAATDLVANDTNRYPDIFLRDTCNLVSSGCSPSTIRISVASDGTQADNISSQPHIDGSFVVFASLADNLVADDTNQRWDVFVRNTCLSSVNCTPSTIRVSVANDGTQSEGDLTDIGISPTPGSGYVAFASSATNLVASDGNGVMDVFIRDTCIRRGQVTPEPGCTTSTKRVSVTGTGAEANGASAAPYVSSDGGVVLFKSSATNLVTNDTNGLADLFVASN